MAARTVLIAQVGSPSCIITGVPATIRAEGVTERLGDIVMSCSGTPGREIIGNLTVSINTTVTNRLVSGSNLDVVLTVNNGSGAVQANAPATLAGNNQITFSGLRFTLGSSGQVELRISNIRADASFGGAPVIPPQFGGNQVLTGQPIIAQLAFNPGGLLNFTTTQFHIGVPERGLYATTLTTVVPSQFGSKLPESIGFAELIKEGTLFASTRVTEGFVSAFEPRQAQSDTGTRLMLRFSGYPSDARLFVPAAIAGSNASTPTAAGDFGGVVSGGRYVAGSHTLLLLRVIGTGPNGAGGYVAAPGFSDSDTYNSMTEVVLTNGDGVAVFEVADSNPQMLESAQVPVFIGLPRSVSERNINLKVQVSFAPLSGTATTTTYAPIPRFADVAPPSDCGVFRDCEHLIPRLEAPPVNMDFTLVQGVGVEQRNIPLGNAGGGLMPWTATIQYKSGRDWILIDPTSGLQPFLIRMIVTARAEMQPATYEATLIIDAGSAGIARYPITLKVVGPPEPPKPKPVVTSLVHGATFEPGPLVRGGLVTLRGSNLAGQNLVVTFDGKPARVLFSNAGQINAQVPSDLTGSTVQVIVTLNGVSSDPLMWNVAAVNPGIFTPGILNQDSTVNSAANPANTGSYVQIYATGLLPPDGSGTVDARLHDQILTNLPFAGPAPGISGVQQVNLQIPQGWPTMMTEVLLCSATGGQRVCSPPVQIHIRQAQ